MQRQSDERKLIFLKCRKKGKDFLRNRERKNKEKIYINNFVLSMFFINMHVLCVYYTIVQESILRIVIIYALPQLIKAYV